MCVFVCVYSVCVYLLYREVVELVAGEEAFANTRTGVTWSTGLQTERKKRLFLFFFISHDKHVYWNTTK